MTGPRTAGRAAFAAAGFIWMRFPAVFDPLGEWARPAVTAAPRGQRCCSTPQPGSDSPKRGDTGELSSIGQPTCEKRGAAGLTTVAYLYMAPSAALAAVG